MLTAQALVIVLALEIRPKSNFEHWLWNLDQEWNIPSTLASTQLALVAGVSLLTAWLARAVPVWQRLYLVGIGLVFLFLAWDEYFLFHEHIQNWEIYYAALGVAVAASTAAAALRSPRHTRIWHLILITGLAMGAFGAMAFEAQRKICGNWGFLRLDGCLWSYEFEESLEFLGIWLTLVAALGLFSEAAPTPLPRLRRALYALPAVWVLLLIHAAFIPATELRLLAQPAAVQFASGVTLKGYRIDSGKEASVLWLYASAKRPNYLGLGYSIHLVDQVSGDSVASLDDYADRQRGVLFAPGHAHVYRQLMEVEIPPKTSTNRALWIVLTLWREQEGDFVRQKALSSDHQLLDDTQVVLGELVIPAVSVASAGAPVAVFDKGFSLAAVEMPERAKPGQSLTFGFTWHSNAQGQDDYAQFLHFVNEESGSWWNFRPATSGSATADTPVVQWLGGR